ncbi:MAG: NAD-dependent epimerase/dehydratase family protein [Rhodobacterales bacterium]|mgnify:FL=1|jgi:uronate dehydrogenase|tara:strand:+ start:2053 stop:2889 length:837 start_codon:yes stop_codon:yes gene_type:complete
MKKLVLTGAGGRLGSYLREPLSKMCDELVSTDWVEDIDTLYPGESYVKADLGSLEQMEAVLEDADMVVHFGAIGDEAAWDAILHSNIIGAYNVWEAAARKGLRRVVYASSIHAVGMYPKTQRIDTEVPHRPDTYYGLAKCFAEDLGSLYWDKKGIESVHLRILSAAQVNNPRSLGTWLSYDDLIHLVERAITTPITGFSIVYGVSNNDRATVDNHKASFLGYRPKDNAEQFSKAVLAEATPADPTDPGQMCQGGPFASVEIGFSGTASMNIVQDKKEI